MGPFQLHDSVFTRSTHYHSVLCVLNRARKGNFCCLNCKVVKWAAGRDVADCPYGMSNMYISVNNLQPETLLKYSVLWKSYMALQTNVFVAIGMSIIV